MIDIRENKRILEKIREYGSPCFKGNEHPYEYIIDDEKVVFYHKITGREIGSTDLELNNATGEKLTAIIEDLKRSIKVEILVSEINNSTLTVETYGQKINALIGMVGEENKALNMLDPHLKSIAYSLIEN
jgi:predicted RNA-binding protein Jag